MRLDSPNIGGPRDAFDAMAYDYGYYFPPTYLPEPWRTTILPRHFPEKHYPLEHFRHAVASGVSTVASPFVHPFGNDPPIFSPLTDVRETKDKYFIDVELPGVDNEADLKLTWMSARTLLVETKLVRPNIDVSETGGSDAKTTTKDDEKPHDGDIKKDDKQATDHSVAITVHERRIGSFARAYSFPVKVDHGKLEASLHAGILRIRVAKLEVEDVHPDHKNIQVEHSGA